MALPKIVKQPFRKLRRDQAELASFLGEWFESDLGQALVRSEQQVLDEVLPSLFGYHALQCSLGKPVPLMSESRIGNKIILRGKPGQEGENCVAGSIPETCVFGSTHNLPFASDSMDLVVLHHNLDFEDDPHQALREAYRTLIPGGKLVVIGFNPWSFWGIARLANLLLKKVPGFARYLNPYRVIEWLHVLNFEVSGYESAYYLPPVAPDSPLASRLSWLEALGARWWSQRGAFYVLLAEKRMSLITPVKQRKRFTAPGGNLVAMPVARKGDD